MESSTISFLADLDKASDSRKANLCRSWKNAVLNDCGVFIENRVDIDVYKSKSSFYPRVTIHCALEYPKVFNSFDVCGLSAGGGCYPGRNSQNFDVHEHAANVALMMEHNLRARVKGKDITDKMIDECIEKFKEAITAENDLASNGICKRCGFEMFNSEMKNGLCAACYALLNTPNEKHNDDGWSVCPICNEKVGALCKSGLCVECDFKKKHPEAEKKICEDCIHFRYHDLYDKNDNTSCCCKLHLEGKNRHDWTYLCKDFVKVDSVEDFDRKYEGLMKYASYKGKEKCEDCGKKFRFTYKGLCLPCYEKKAAKAEEIARGFTAEGLRPVPENERENAKFELGGWTDETKMDATEPRKGTRFFLIDVKSLTWKFFFRKEA